MKSKLSILALALVLSACSSDNDKKPGATGGGSTKGELADVTDKSSCSGAPAPGLSLYNTNWRQSMQDGDLRVDTNIVFYSSNQGAISNTCYYPDGTRVAVQLPFNVIISSNSIQFLYSEEKTETAQYGANKYECSVGVNAGTAQYALTGQCVALSFNGQTEYLVK
jgi:hypothetical protein